ncbi:(R)-citramalate synthase [Candidatus Calditenuaceae archaeon HR02]|nr:(R)-citramalate synthase [Candidatus Calditenuaceae archaeon HR02]
MATFRHDARGVSIDYVELLDTTLRDGAQTRGVSLSLRDKLRIAEKLDELGIDIIEAGWPGANPKDSEFYKAVKSISLTHSKLAVFGSTKHKNSKVDQDPMLKSLVEADVPYAVVFGKSWLLHVREVLRATPEENLRMIGETVNYLKDHGIKVIFDAEHFFDGWKDSPSYALAVLRAASEAGAETLVLCDTNGGTLPSQLFDIVKKVGSEIKAPLGIHAHNDAGCATANSLAAVEAGVRHVQGTFIGLGERCGNADLAQIIPALRLKMGFKVLKDGDVERLKKLTEVARFIASVTGFHLAPNHPYVGRNAFAHKGGVHIDAIIKHPRTYEHIDPSLVGNERVLSISEQAGRSALMDLARRMGLNLSKDELRAATEEVKRMEAFGYHLEPAEATVILLILKHIGMYRELFQVKNWWVESVNIGRKISRAIVTISVNGDIVTAMGEGVGPVHALDEAVRSGISSRFPALKDVSLTDYKVYVVDSKEGTAAYVRVFTEFTWREKSWITTSVSNNIIEASLSAIIDGYRYLLLALEPGLLDNK